MNVYLDTEFNGHGGQLVSIALFCENGDYFYGVLPPPKVWHPWVLEHVVPYIGQEPEPVESVRARLRAFLSSREGVTIYADWPADFVHLLNLFVGPSYDQAFVPGIKMVLLRNSAPVPVVAHNALSDAEALMNWHQRNVALEEYERNEAVLNAVRRRAAAIAARHREDNER